MAAGFVVAMLKGSSEARSVSVGMNAALQALVSAETIPRSLRYAECDKMPNSIRLPLSGKIEVS